ncbi:hypothetical protein HanRHA438_Chr14g0640751 [Helianthus annuus]|nr:hypothetical protein HanRHA438_Chr14g0640751 [Helianthus annuus]
MQMQMKLKFSLSLLTVGKYIRTGGRTLKMSLSLSKARYLRLQYLQICLSKQSVSRQKYEYGSCIYL